MKFWKRLFGRGIDERLIFQQALALGIASHPKHSKRELQMFLDGCYAGVRLAEQQFGIKSDELQSHETLDPAQA